MAHANSTRIVELDAVNQTILELETKLANGPSLENMTRAQREGFWMLAQTAFQQVQESRTAVNARVAQLLSPN